VSALSGVVVQGVAAGRWHSLARTADGALYSWGGGGFGRLGHGDEARPRPPLTLLPYNPNPNPDPNPNPNPTEASLRLPLTLQP